MKNNFDRTKTATARFSTRAIAMMLFFVMLITAIGTGSMLNTFAAYISEHADDGAISTAAAQGSDIAKGAIPAEDDSADAAPDLSGFEENEIVKGLKNSVDADYFVDEAPISRGGKDVILADTGASVDLAGTGYTAGEFAVEGSWDSYTTHEMNGSTGYTHNFTSTGTYYIQFKADNTDLFWADNVTISDSIHDYFMQKKTGSTTMQITIPRTGDYVFKCTGLDGVGTSPKFQIDYPPEDPALITWTVAGDNTTLFGTPTWDETKVANELALQSGGTYDGKYTKSWSNVYLKKGDIKFKVLKNHAWTTAYPSSNKVVTIPSAGYYNVVVVYDNSDHSVNMYYEAAATYTFALGSTDNATVTATYGSTTVNEGGTISSVPGGVDVNISVTPDSGYKATGVTTDPFATVTGSGESWTVTMPTANVTATATVVEYSAPTKRVYFYNKFTQYPMVTIYAYHKDSSGITDEIFGPNGRTMNKMDNSDLWYIDLPEDAYIVFKGEGYSTGELAPLQDHDSEPKYIPGPSKTAPGTGGYWGEYLARNNVYSVSDGTTMSAENLYTSINATFFDYYVDSEVTNGWLTGITSDSDYNGYTHDTNNDPYRDMLNKALSDYADNDTETSSGNIVGGPANNITYPLYWGNNPSAVAALHNFKIAANNSSVLDPSTTAIQGLAGDKLTGNIIHHFNSGATDNNGAAMAFFDEDFLSGNNSLQKALATILHSPSFPVRKENEKTLCLDLSSHDGGWESGTTYIAANFYNTNTTDTDALRVLMTKVADHKYTVSVPSGYTKVEWLKFGSADISGNSTYYKSAGAFSTNDTYAFSSGTGSSVEGSWSTDATIGQGHTYYEYDSTNGKDNAFITDIDTTAHTALLNYYDSSQNVKVMSNIGNYGFFPFDYNNITSGGYDVKRIYLNRNGHFSLENSPKFYAYFFDSSDNHEWVEMQSYNGSDSLYYCDIPTTHDYTKVTFTRNHDSSGWDNVWNQTIDADIPSNTLEVVYYIYSEKDEKEHYKGGWGTSQSVRVPRKVGSANGYADSDHVAHDQGFGMKLEIPFTLSANGLNDDLSAQVFEFSGDDDLWVYIDNNLVLDLGGAHGATRGSINFNTMEAIANKAVAISTAKDATTSSKASGTTLTKDFSSIINTKAANFNSNKIHTMTIYYMERGMYDSNLKFGYSFHAIDSLLQTEKKVRTRSDDANRKINAGFFIDNGQAGAASNMSGHYIDNGEREITKFEDSFQDDTFTITQNYPSDDYLLADSITYTIGDAVNTAQKNEGSANFTYDLHNDNDGDQIANFNGQFISGTSINLKETINDAANKFRYDPSFTVYDDARTVSGSQKFEFDSGNGTDIGTVHEESDGSYTFNFSPSVKKSGIEDLRLRARFTNQMKCHSLTLRKLINDTNTTATFTFKILFSFDNGASYISYPLELKSGGSLANDGTITFKANESVTMLGIPERALVKIIETATTNNSYAYTGAEVTTVTGNDVPDTAEVTTGLAGSDLGGVQFTMANEDVDVDVKNADGEPVYISHSLLPASTGTGGTYVAAYVVDGPASDTLANVGGETCSNIMTTNVIKIPKEFITYNSTNYLKIELQTYPDEGNEFIDFYEQITDTLRILNATGSSPAYTVTKDLTEGVNKVTVRIAINALFNAKHAQLYTELPFYSALGAQLKITHKIDPSSPDAATTSPNGAVTKVRARVKTAAGVVQDWYNGTSDVDWTYVNADDSLTIPAKYFWNNMVDAEGTTHTNNLILEVQLETTVFGFSQLKNVSLFGNILPESGAANDGAILTYTKDIPNRKVNISVSYNISNLFDGSTPKYTELPYLSLLEVPDYEYTFNYTYPAFISGYGNQTFTVHDKFSTAELEENMTFEEGKLIFKPDEVGVSGKKYASDFINAHAPYEDNFQKLVRISNFSYSDSNPTDITYNVTMLNNQEHFTVYMNLPYATDEAHFNDYDYVVTDGRVVQTASHSEAYTNVYNKQWFTKNIQCRFPYQVTDGNQPSFVKAPLIIYEGDTPRYFKYWQVETISQYNTSAREYTRCYDYEFNLALFQPCTITPIYSDDADVAANRATFAERGMPNPPTTYDMYSRFDPEVNRRWFVDTNAVTIAFLENSRNQYNNCQKGTGEAVSTILGKRQGAADIIYSSFLMTFDSEYDGDKTVVLSEKYKDSPGEMECGLIFEGVAKLEGSDEAGYTVHDDTYYANYAATNSGDTKYAGMSTDHIKNVLEGKTSFTNPRTIRAQLDVTALDNKNRIQYHYGIDAAKPHSTEEETANPLSALSKSGNKTYVYKAYAYIGKTTSNDGVLSDVKVSATPVYFTIYNDANISPGNTLDLPAGYSTTVE